MSEAELHVLRTRLEGGIRNKAARGALRRGLPVGLVWGEEDGDVRFHPDEAVIGAIRAVFERFAEQTDSRSRGSRRPSSSTRAVWRVHGW
jgi:DNA invertase Pin-like site-specific DNA recombinase